MFLLYANVGKLFTVVESNLKVIAFFSTTKFDSDEESVTSNFVFMFTNMCVKDFRIVVSFEIVFLVC